jgi:hypothetical protein
MNAQQLATLAVAQAEGNRALVAIHLERMRDYRIVLDRLSLALVQGDRHIHLPLETFPPHLLDHLRAEGFTVEPVSQDQKTGEFKNLRVSF